MALPFLSVTDCARHFSFSERTVYEMIKSGELRAEKFGSYLIAWPDAWACEQGPVPRPELYMRYMSDLLSRQALARRSGRSLRTVDRWLDSGLPTRNVRASVRVNPVDAAEWLRGKYGTSIRLNRLLACGTAPPVPQNA
ncbi:AlpA family transcriptional regulator [Roseovarius sp. A-2]|uniref:helix-turn-helix transcriptional regulator n=1 Tax=Roseovarius sp. A-2 TaxID=1570360 RepID=UPI0015948D1D|nr:helix-turn-helix domain-containing protein [Roseovarius sp. A-2]